MPSWDPQQYLAFSDHRLRPGLELLSRIGAESPRVVVDLGCGPGNLTSILAQRWPDAKIIGVDTSPSMLERARSDFPDITFVEGDAATWTCDDEIDVLFSNATLHWVPNHAELLPRLIGQVAPTGWFAMQVPNNFDAPTHRLLRRIAGEELFAPAAAALLHDVVGTPAEYIDLLTGLLELLDVWETTYHQVLQGPDAVLEWSRGTALRPALEALDDAAAGVFESAYRTGLRAAYPPRSDGSTILPFRRLFVLGRRVSDEPG